MTHTGRNGHGRFKIIIGCMASMKTGLLVIELDRVHRASLARRGAFAIHPVAFKSNKDTRSPKGFIASRIEGLRFPAREVESASEILEQLPAEATFVAIDEPQFFGPELIPVIRQLLNQGIDVVAAGLDMDFRKEPFPLMASLTGIANEVIKVPAICVVCGREAFYTQRLMNSRPAPRSGDLLVVEGADQDVTYEARCGGCHELPE